MVNENEFFNYRCNNSNEKSKFNQFCSPNNSNCSVANTSNAGATFDHQFTSIGTYLYFCQIHGAFGMTGTIVVKP